MSDLVKQIKEIGYFMSMLGVDETGGLVLRPWGYSSGSRLESGDNTFARTVTAVMDVLPVLDMESGEVKGARDLAKRWWVDTDSFVEVSMMHQDEVKAETFRRKAEGLQTHDGMPSPLDGGWTYLSDIVQQVRDFEFLTDGGIWADAYLDAQRTSVCIGDHIDEVMATSVPENVPMSEIDAFLSTEAGLAAYERALSDSYQTVGETPLANLYEVARKAIAQTRADALKENLPDVLMLGALKTIARKGGVAVDDTFVEALQDNFADITPDMPEKAISEALTGAYEYVEPYDVPGLPLPMQVCGVMTESDLVFVACERANARRAEEQAARNKVPAKEQAKRRPAAAEREARSAASMEPRQQAREVAKAR